MDISQSHISGCAGGWWHKCHSFFIFYIAKLYVAVERVTLELLSQITIDSLERYGLKPMDDAM